MSHPELAAARRAIALGRITAFDDECWRLAELVRDGVINIGNDLSATFGADLVQTTMADAFRRHQLGHGKFGAWIEAEFGRSARTAQKYMRAAEVFGPKCEAVSHLPEKAIHLLAAKATRAEMPKPANDADKPIASNDTEVRHDR